MTIDQIRQNDSKLDWLYSLREAELNSLDKLDVARASNDPHLQEQALNELRRAMIDFAFGEYLIPTDKSQYKIDYSYYTDWKEGKRIKTIHSEIEKEERNRKREQDAIFEKRYGYKPH